jgi:hypothetical protein
MGAAEREAWITAGELEHMVIDGLPMYFYLFQNISSLTIMAVFARFLSFMPLSILWHMGLVTQAILW